MATKKITELTELTSASSSDLLPIVDDAATNVTKKVTVGNLTDGLNNETIVDNTVSTDADNLLEEGTDNLLTAKAFYI